jgi:hypothetical protein
MPASITAATDQPGPAGSERLLLHLGVSVQEELPFDDGCLHMRSSRVRSLCVRGFHWLSQTVPVLCLT